MKSPYEKTEAFGNRNRNETNGSNSTRKFQNKNKMKKNITRMGGGGLSLETFANAKSKNNAYNPAIIKKQREFYKTAKCVNKYKKTLKQQRPGDISLNIRLQEDNIENGETSGGMNKKNSKNRKLSAHSLKQLYEEKHEEQEKARKEREVLFRAKKEEREKAESKRKDVKKKMFKKTKSGQPVMRYRIEHLLETIQASANE